MQTMPAAIFDTVILCLFLPLSFGVKHLVTTNNNERYIVETKSDGNPMDYLDSYAETSSDSKQQPEKVKSKRRTKPQQSKGSEYLVTTDSSSDKADYIVELENFEVGKNEKNTIKDSEMLKVNSQSKSNHTKDVSNAKEELNSAKAETSKDNKKGHHKQNIKAFRSMRMEKSTTADGLSNPQFQGGVKNFTEYHHKRNEMSSGGTLYKRPKSNVSVVEDGQDYSNSPPGHDPDSPETNPEGALKVEQTENPEALTIDILKPREDEHLFNHDMESEGTENLKVDEDNKTALEEANSKSASHPEGKKILDFEEKHIPPKSQTHLGPNQNKSKTDTFKEIHLESPQVKKEITMQNDKNTELDKSNPNPISTRPTESHNYSTELSLPSGVEHGQDYGDSEPDNGPESKLKDTFDEIIVESPLVKKELTRQEESNTKQKPSDVEHGQDYGNSEPDNEPENKLNVTFDEIIFESPLVKKELTMQEESNPKQNPSDVEHGQDYGISEPDNEPNSKIKADFPEEKGTKEAKPHK